MQTIELDEFDMRLLGALQTDGRLTNQELADKVGLSASQCSRRRARLEESGIIRGYHADLSPEALGLGVLVFVHVTLSAHSPDNSKRFRDLVACSDDIQEAYSLTGETDYLLKMVLPDLKSLAATVNERLLAHDTVALLGGARPAQGNGTAAAEANTLGSVFRRSGHRLAVRNATNRKPQRPRIARRCARIRCSIARALPLSPPR